MGGIAGIFAFDPNVPAVVLARVRRTAGGLPRGADNGVPLWCPGGGQIGLAGRGADAADGPIRIVFDGTLYNAAGLRAELAEAGIAVAEDDEADLLRRLYLRHGTAMLDRLRGPFALAVWDERSRSLMLARDGFGLRPLYYGVAGGMLHFASWVRALRAGGVVGQGVSAAGHVGFFLWGHVPEPHTLYADIHALPPGHSLTVAAGKRPGPPVCHFDPAAEFRASGGDLWHGGGPEDLRRQLQDALAAHTPSGAAQTGLLLSGDAASGALCGLLAARGSGPPAALTVVAASTKPAASVAQAYHARYTAVPTVAAGDDRLAAIAKAMDQPSLGAVRAWRLAEAARALGWQVALSGHGGTALFQGTPAFRRIPKLVHRQTRLPFLYLLGRPLRRLSAPALARLRRAAWAGVLEYGTHYPGAYLLERAVYLPWELPGVLDPDLVREGWQALDPLGSLDRRQRGIAIASRTIALFELTHRLPAELRDLAWAGEAHGIALRAPYADVPLFRALAPALARTAGPDMAALAAVPEPPLPTAATAPRPAQEADGGRTLARRLYALATTAGQRG